MSAQSYNSVQAAARRAAQCEYVTPVEVNPKLCHQIAYIKYIPTRCRVGAVANVRSPLSLVMFFMGKLFFSRQYNSSTQTVSGDYIAGTFGDFWDQSLAAGPALLSLRGLCERMVLAVPAEFR